MKSTVRIRYASKSNSLYDGNYFVSQDLRDNVTEFSMELACTACDTNFIYHLLLDAIVSFSHDNDRQKTSVNIQ